ncbi:MAG: hypothetical protein D6741_04365 [Planctomycetota bacterium]|nr:MAG: hypothetical protein D6741_04365 [Planctomycetota bacterium]
MYGMDSAVLMAFRRREYRRRLLVVQFRRAFAEAGWPQHYAEDDGPREGDTKRKGTREYIFHDHRWHVLESPLVVSPNTAEDLPFEEAVRRLHSEEHRAMKEKFLEQAKKIVGEPSKVLDVVGDWKDGSENSVLLEWDRPVPFDQLQYAAARMGLEANQKAVVWLAGAPDGEDQYYRFTAGVPVDELRDRLTEAGFVAWSLDLTHANGIGVYLLVLGKDGLDQIREFEARHQSIIVPKTTLLTPGHFGGLEGDTREEAAEVYRRVIEEYERRFRRLRPVDREKWRRIFEERRRKALALVPPGPNATWEEKKMYAIRRAMYGSGEPVDFDAMERLDMEIAMGIAHINARARYSAEEGRAYPSVFMAMRVPNEASKERIQSG